MVVVGGGYREVAVAKALDQNMDVVLIEPKDAFMHNIAALRALVDPSWLPRIYLPYDKLLATGRVVRDRAAVVEPGRVVTASGQAIVADYVVLATGSSYAFPAKTDKVDTQAAHDQVPRRPRRSLRGRPGPLAGGGSCRHRLAGEIGHVWPDKSVTLFDVSGELLGGPFKPELRAELRRQLAEVGVEVLLGSRLRAAPSTAPGELGTFTVTTEDGSDITADIWFQCFGVVPNSDYLGEVLLPALRADGFVRVEPTLQVVGQTTVFTVGDLSTADAKMAAFTRPRGRDGGRQHRRPGRRVGSDRLSGHGTGDRRPDRASGRSRTIPRPDDRRPDLVADLKGRDMESTRSRSCSAGRRRANDDDNRSFRSVLGGWKDPGKLDESMRRVVVRMSLRWR